MAIEIRAATYADVFKIVDCRMEFLFEIYGSEMTCEFRVATIEYLEKHINSDSMVCYLAIEDGEIISIVILCVYYLIPKLHNHMGKVGYIFSVYTLKEYRGQGLAKELMSRTIETAKRIGVKEIYLNGEEKAIPMYKKLGFECVEKEMVLKLE
ncbi:GNAT family N-acetyltransferase [Desulfosporosinus fructosivorans]|uniref:GNAT family N-acetyltransferase n=1 Tax=Desulfosporosinus fructosivorans TaxID=2018669 RepID=A0A4Z0RA25_9FIRM|nr:GNAT family N-acetyltransferase [Desulfosporosinus fructosivorans]TGE39225.1 GNAT family N-acetyltransferase [Desulfosporosinus fructosivorans]